MYPSRRDPIVAEAIKKGGGHQKLAEKLGCTRYAIYYWARIPMSRVKEVAEITGISRKRLRPDIFG